MNKYQVAKNFIERNVNYNHIKKLFPDMDEMNLSLDYFQELIDNYSKLEKSLDYLLNYLDKKYLLDDEKSFSRYLYKELLEEDIRRMLEREKQ